MSKRSRERQRKNGKRKWAQESRHAFEARSTVPTLAPVAGVGDWRQAEGALRGIGSDEPAESAIRRQRYVQPPQASPPPSASTNLASLGVTELKALAKAKGIRGYSKLRKEELVTALL